MFARNNLFENANGTGIFEARDLAGQVLVGGRNPRVPKNITVPSQFVSQALIACSPLPAARKVPSGETAMLFCDGTSFWIVC